MAEQEKTQRNPDNMEQGRLRLLERMKDPEFRKKVQEGYERIYGCPPTFDCTQPSGQSNPEQE